MKRVLKPIILMLSTVAALGAMEPLAGDAESSWRSASPGYAWAFPRDLYAHPDFKTEWWYITGNLTRVDDGRPLGYQLTFFRSGLAPAAADEPRTTEWDPVDLIMGHAAVSDAAAGRHVFSEVVWRTHPMLGGFGVAPVPGDASPADSTGAQASVAWCRAPAGTDARWSLDYRDGTYHLRVRDDARGLRYELECRPTLPPLFHGRDGFSPKSASGREGSLYFSQTRMATRGRVWLNGKAVAVKGTSWLDREIFTSTLAAGQVGWDWFALRLRDGSDLMLYRLRDGAGATDFALGTWRRPDGTVQVLEAGQWSLEPGTLWTSPATGSPYPTAFTLRLPGHAGPVRVEALFPEQENVSERTGIHYWEGAVRVLNDKGEELGQGFVELTGYGQGSRPPI